ncbi:MAG: helix-turn-helix transcriptional regulator [Clostridia bacterium]|nr:helix-turn-helix transcriptional regulator [Clostridia bacterium]
MDVRQTGSFIRELRKEKEMTQQDLAEKLNVTDKAISRWETGRGLPDADSMMALSSFFSVTINELLLGRKNRISERSLKDDADIAVDLLKASRTKKRLGILIALIGATFIFVLALACMATVALYKRVMGSANCVIAQDYSSITIFGNRYVPFDIKDNDCEPGAVLISEASVENAVFITKLFFGDQIQLVNGCDNIDFIYLNSENDVEYGNYYCLEGAVEKYTELMNAPKDRYVAKIFTKDWVPYDYIIDVDIVQAISSLTENERDFSVNGNFNRFKGEDAISVYAKQSSGPFRCELGELLYKNGRYYWFDYSDIPANMNNSDFSEIVVYDLPERLNGNLTALFGMMFK